LATMGMFFMSEEEEGEVEAAPPVDEAVADPAGGEAEEVAHDAFLAEEAHTEHTPDAPAVSDVDAEAAPDVQEVEAVPPAVPVVDEEQTTPPPVEEAPPPPPEAPVQVIDAVPAEPAVELPLPVVTDAAQEWAVCSVPLADLSALHPYVPYAAAAPVLDALGAGWAALEARGAATGAL
jgi:hypothetical protein